MFLLRGILLKHEPDTFNYATFVALNLETLAGEASLYEELGVDSGANDKEIKWLFGEILPPKGGWWWFVNSTSYTSPRNYEFCGQHVVGTMQLFVSPSLMQNSIHSPHQPQAWTLIDLNI